MANPALNEKRFEDVRKEWDPGWAAGASAAAATTATATGVAQTEDHAERAPARTGVMTANGTFAKTFVLFLLVLAGGAIGWSQTKVSPAGEVDIPGWTWICLFAAFGVAMVCVFKPKTSPFLAPLYALLEGVFLGAISKAFELRWDGIVFQAVLATVGVFFATLALYVFGVVKVTKQVPDGRDRRDRRHLPPVPVRRAAVAVRRRRHVLERAERARASSSAS